MKYLVTGCGGPDHQGHNISRKVKCRITESSLCVFGHRHLRSIHLSRATRVLLSKSYKDEDIADIDCLGRSCLRWRVAPPVKSSTPCTEDEGPTDVCVYADCYGMDIWREWHSSQEGIHGIRWKVLHNWKAAVQDQGTWK